MAKTLSLLTIALLLAGCNVSGIPGNRRIVNEQRQVLPFTNLDTGGSFNIEWANGAPSAVVSVDDNLQQYVEVKVTGNTLRLRTTRDIRPSHSLKVTLTSSALEAVALNGASRLVAHNLSGPKFYVEGNGATKVVVDGTVEEMIANMTGASNLAAEDLQTKRAQVSVTGAGKAQVTASDELKVSITGAGKVEYGGHPARVERDITGAGSIRQRE